MVKFLVEGDAIEVDERVQGLTNFFKDLSDFQGKKEDIELNTHKKQEVLRLLEACKIVDYKFNEVSVVNQSDPAPYIGGPLSQFLKNLNCKSII